MSDDISVSIPGLTYVPEYVSAEQEEAFFEHVDSGEWITELKRRVQHFGYRYDYKARSVAASSYLGPLPEWSEEIAHQLVSDVLFPQLPDQLIVNEYLPGQGISAHVDCVPCFAHTIASLSLGSTCLMRFKNVHTREKIELLLQPRSLVVLANEARYDWTHAIPDRRSDTWEDEKLERSRRLSLTFRNVILDEA